MRDSPYVARLRAEAAADAERPTDAEVIAAYRRGGFLACREIGATSQPAVERILRAACIAVRPRGRPRVTVDLREVARLWADGFSRERIAERLGVTARTLARVLRHEGLELPWQRSTPGVVGRGSGPVASPGAARATDDTRKNPRGARGGSSSPSVGGAGVPTRGGAA